MKLQTLTKTLTIGLIGVGAALTLQSPSQAQARFECLLPVTGRYVGVPTTYAKVGSNERKPVIRWVSRYSSGSGYTPQQRCLEVTKRFNTLDARPRGIDIITTGYLNGLPVIYSPSHGRERANSSNLLFTLKKGEDATQKIQLLFDLRAGHYTEPLFESSSDSVIVYFNKFLENAPVETNQATGSSPSPLPETSTEQPPQKPSGGSVW
ncbi:COP23 domain-containing protein [Microcystis aeruginosa]|uniref:COP23 domain-containing protein n=1 Tax=Microcystis aeruginosa TaxID=1126 RepID=UPI00292F2A73|nr:COP23 domain-containing protein [Microcystis aeruginosa]WOB67177.1 COP23 domain-containing protein [Microcystis aeruginosa LE3]